MQCLRIGRITLALLMWVSVAHASTAQPAYRITLLTPLAGYTSGFGAGINSSGVVAGSVVRAGTDYGCRAVTWKDGVPTELPASQDLSFGNGINDDGVVVGCVAGPDQTYGCMWNAGGLVDISARWGHYCNDAADINNSGQIAGAGSYGADLTEWPTRDKDGVLAYLPRIVGGGGVTAINNNGQVVGSAYFEDGPLAFLWDGDVLTQLGPHYSLNWSAANDINDACQVVGEMGTSGQSIAFIWENGSMSELVGLGGMRSCANGINDHGQIVGYSSLVGDSGCRACTWNNGVITDVNSLLPSDSGWVLSRATKVNDAGMIIGEGYFNGVDSGFLMTPVPEPSSILSLLCGCLGVLAYRRRRG